MTEATKSTYWKMKKDELVSVLVENGIEFDPDNMNRKEAIEKLVQKQAEAGELTEGVMIDEDGEASAVKPKKEWVEIIFHNQDGQPKYVFLGLNGQFLYLPRECPCRIPADFLEVVKSATYIKIVQTTTPDNKVSNREVRVPRLSYEVTDRGVIG